MGKHISKELRYHYIERVKRGEGIMEIINEMIEKGHTASKDVNTISRMLKMWAGFHKYKLKEDSEKKKKGKIPKPKYDEMTKEELIEKIEQLEYINDLLKKLTKVWQRCGIVGHIKEKFGWNTNIILKLLNISSSRYYEWVKCEKNNFNYDVDISVLVKEAFERNNKTFGALRLVHDIDRHHGVKFNIKTIRRYMKLNGLICIIRNKQGKKELKDTSTILYDFVKRRFDNTYSREILCTDTTEYQNGTFKAYISGVIQTSNLEILDLTCGLKNDMSIMEPSVKNAIKKVGRKFILHSDNAPFYRGPILKRFVELHGGISSYSYPGDSIDNRVIEYFWGVAKTEYLDLYKPTNLSELIWVINKAKNHYNKIRIQGKLDWKTPYECRG